MPFDFTTPEWVKDAVFYQIFPDRFARSDRVPTPPNLEPWDSLPTVYGFKGGDLLGVAERLDYLRDLGINALYFNPIFQSAANHRYHTHDYYRVDPLLGGDAAFYELLEKAHCLGIHIVLDGVFNHASRGFFQFNHILENEAASPYLDWFIVRGFPLNAYQGPPNYQCLDNNLPALPEFNTDNPEVRTFLFNVARYWLEQGIDGWRLDVPYKIEDDGFWREFRQLVKTVNPEAYIVGEVWSEARHWLQGDQFDAVMNYVFNRACICFFGGEHLHTNQRLGVFPLQPLSATQFADAIDDLLALYDWKVTLVQLNLLSSHDMPRFLTLVQGDKAALQLATLFQMTFPGAPCVYYGDEIGMAGGHDPDCRRAFPWNEACWDHELLTFFRRAIALRHAHPALRRGRYLRLCADGRYGIYGFARQTDGETLVVVLNNGPTGHDLDVPAQGLFIEGTVLRDLWGGGQAQVVTGRITGMMLPARSGVVLAVEENFDAHAGREADSPETQVGQQS